MEIKFKCRNKFRQGKTNWGKIIIFVIEYSKWQHE